MFRGWYKRKKIEKISSQKSTIYLIIIPIVFLFSLSSCESKRKTKKYSFPKKTYAKVILGDSNDPLIPISNDKNFSFDSPCAFVNIKGDTIIPFGKFTFVEPDTLIDFVIVRENESGFIGINREGECIFDAYIYGDFQFDTFYEERIRIIQNGKIGYANERGIIVIKPQYKCASIFENGKAKVAYSCSTTMDELGISTQHSDAWIYIDKNGNELKK